jgi:predicted short-subunit dehydrogenase-like oxidoreductase (DUF2520 family)
MTKSLAIVGPGRVGRALGGRLRESGWRVDVVAARTAASAKRGVRLIGAGRATAGIPPTLAGASVILLTVPDDAIASVAAELAHAAREDLRGKIVLHTSGALDSSILAPLELCGAATGSIHPLQSFSGVSVPPLEGRVFAIEGDEAAIRAARRIARSVGGVPVGICASRKPLYHAACGFAAGLCLALEEGGARLLMTAGLKRREGVRALVSLTRQVLDNYERLGPQKAWTGPLARGDFSVVAAHEKALAELQPEYLNAYQAMSRLAACVLASNPPAMLHRLDAISRDADVVVARAKGGYE